MADPLAEALGAFRRFNYDHIYMRPESVQQSASVIRVLRALVEHYAEHPGQLPDHEPDEPAPVVDAGTDRAVRRAVTYVAGMTDRFAFEPRPHLLGWATTDLPLGIG